MTAQFGTFLLIFPLALSLDTAFEVAQTLRQPVTYSTLATVVCEVKNGEEGWQLDIKLKRKSEDTVACRVSDKPQDCFWRKEEWNRTLFTLFNLEPNDKELFVCELTRMYPLPVLIRKGNGTLLISDATVNPVALAPIKSQCPDPGPFNSVLIGLVVFFAISNLMAIWAYIKLRTQHGKQMEDSMVYMPMQGRVAPETISDYINIRKLQPGSATSCGDMKYNPYQMQD